ncbi:MAG: carboxymuconolactone decarboxylase family protein [Marmoricola sp.]
MSDNAVFDGFPRGYKGLAGIEVAISQSSVPEQIRELVKMRCSQINGCAYCVDMHYKDARAAGETEERLYMLSAWREATVYSDAERAALALAEAITLISQAHVPAEVEAEAKRHFDTEAYAALVWVIVMINAWNRLAITGHSEPGHYVAAQAA